MVLGVILNVYFYLNCSVMFCFDYKYFPNIMNILFSKKLNSLFKWKSKSLGGRPWQVSYFTQTAESVGGDHTKPASPFEPSVASSRESH